MGKPISELEGAFIIPSRPSGDLDMVTDNIPPSQLFDLTDRRMPAVATTRSSEQEPRIGEPYIEIADTKISTRGGNLASTALENIMVTFNKANRKRGLDKSTKGVPDHRFNTHFGGAKASLPYRVAGSMESDTLNATLDERGVIKVSNPKQQKEPKHKKDLDVLNNTDVKRAEGRDEEIIEAERDALKNWLIDNYGPGAVQKIKYTAGSVDHDVTHEDREKLVEKVRKLEEDAKKIASGEMLPYGSISSDEEPISEEDRDGSSEHEQEVGI